METKVKIIEGVGQQEEEAAEELKGFVAQEMLRGFLDFRRLCSFFEAQDQMQNSTRKLQQPFRLQSSSCRVIYDEERKKKSYYQDIIGSFFFRRVDRVESTRNQKLCHQRQA